MNSNGLARRYGALTPWERLPLIVAASARGDEVEADRLARSAPKKGLKVPDYWALWQGLKELAMLYLVRQLDLAALYERVAGRLEQRPLYRGKKRNRRQERRLRNGLRMLARCGVTQADGWGQFCGLLHIDPDAVLCGLPGREAVRRMVEEARLAAFSAEEAAAYVAEHGSAPAEEEATEVKRDGAIDTAEGVARAMREHLEALLHV